jgi:phosphate starvation-inducible PhoH-like protein
MKMFLTRIGVNSRVVITGDKTQIDLPPSQKSGLIQVEEILKDVKGIEFVYLDERDVTRHRLVKQIVLAYAAADRRQADDDGDEPQGPAR